MVAWKACTRPTELGGLGITDLRLAGLAFQAKWLYGCKEPILTGLGPSCPLNLPQMPSPSSAHRPMC